MKAIPKTTNEQILKYNTAFEVCHCPDFESRGGSYIDPANGDRVCKHVAHVRAQYRQVLEHNLMIEAQALEAQENKAKQAIERLYGKPSVQEVQPTWSLLDYLEIDPPRKKYSTPYFPKAAY